MDKRNNTIEDDEEFFERFLDRNLYTDALEARKAKDLNKCASKALECYNLRIDVLGEDNIETYEAYNLAIESLMFVRKYDEALTYAFDCYDKECKVFTENHSCSLRTAGYLCHLLNIKKRNDEAVRLAKQSLEVIKNNTLNAYVIINTCNYLLMVLSANRVFEEAFDAGNISYNVSVKLYGEDHPRTLMALCNLANIHAQSGDFKKAIEMQNICWKARIKVLGEKHPDTITSLFNIARYFGDAGVYKQATKIMSEVYSYMCEVYGKQHPRTATAFKLLESYKLKSEN